MKHLLSWSSFAFAVGITWLYIGPVLLGGPASYVIVDGRSMEPTYQNGDLIITRQQDSYAIGDIIVYDAPVDRQFNVIHRIVEPAIGGFVTQGDNMDRPDGWIAPDETIYGAAWLHIPRGGQIVTFLRQPAAIAGLIAGLISFELLKRREQRSTMGVAEREASEAGAP
jgi:signal peptidase I